MDSTESITRMLNQLRGGQDGQRDEAAARIWQHYFPRLLALARKRLDGRVRRREDEEDVLQSMYKSFCLRQERGDFELGGRDDLWRLLVHITLQKVRNVVARQQAQRRDYRVEQSGGGEDSGAEVAFDNLQEADPTPDQAAALEEEAQRRLDELPDDLRQIVLWKLAGYTNEEIAGADMLDCSVRTVERKLNLVRQRWEAALSGDEA